jgi:pimeloyl-ACP methyl ester carboxylesterase
MRALAVILGVLFIVPSCQAQHTTHEITFESGPFHVVGDLQLPDGPGPYPVILFVHGDGPNNRTSGVTYPPIMERMLRAGYATFAWDKPGTGESTGQIDRSRLGEQRAQIVLDAIAVLKPRPDIDVARIGMWGISQAGYVMPRVLTKTDDIAFMIAVSCPGEPGVEQGAFLVTAQARCAEALSDDDATEMERLLSEIELATTYNEYVHHKTALRAFPAFMALEEEGMFVGVQPESRWHAPNLEGEYFFDPAGVIEQVTIPVLAFFGERDTQADPIQGTEAYRDALARGGNPLSRVELIPGVDHNIILSETGCMSERDRRSRAGWRNYAAEYLDILEEWLRGLPR